MGEIKQVEEFYCPRCGYITRNEFQIECIKGNNNQCPACFDGKHKGLTLSHEDSLPIYQS